MCHAAGRLRAVRESEILGGRYRLREQLRVAGVWQVWRADDGLLVRAVTLSMCDAAYPVEVVGELPPHPHLVRVFDAGEAVLSDGSRLRYVVSELLAGTRLDEQLARGPLRWPVAARIGSEIAAALATLHDHGAAFGDLRAADVALAEGRAKLAWLGVRGAAADAAPADDVYALGRLVYEMVLGRPPSPAVLSSLAVGGMPPSVVELCRRCLTPNPAERPSSHEVAVLLAEAVPVGDAAPVEESVFEPPTRNLPLVVRPGYAAQRPNEPDDAGGIRVPPPVVPTPPPVSPVPPAIEDSPERSAGRRLVGIVAAGAVLVAATIASLAWFGIARTGATSAAAAPLEVSGAAATVDTGCVVLYQIRDETADTVTVDITVTNAGTRTWHDWTLAFRFTADQRVVHGQVARWRQAGNDVTATDSAAVEPRRSATVGFTGTHGTTDPWPTSFTVDGTACAYTVVDGAGNVRSTGTPSPAPGTSTGTGTTSPGATPTTQPAPSPSPDPRTSSGTPTPSGPSSTGHDGDHGKPSGKSSHH
jgi:serine/threonine-protein kinase